MANISSSVPPLIGRSQSLLDVLERVSEVAALDRPVLVIGERGTGKELIAARLHYLSARWNAPLVKINCAALAESLLETELFGHEAGAFTGAMRQRAGRFELAHRGSLFLDEVANASLRTQEKVLRIIEYGEYERVGGSLTLTTDVRLIGATHKDLPAEAEAARFRHDLLDRLAFEVLTVPPLRARREDIPLLAEHFARAMALELGWEGFPGFSAEVAEQMLDYAWPGNVRELKNVVERAVYRAPGPQAPIGRLILDPFASPYRASFSTLAMPLQPTVQPERKDGSEPLDLRALLLDTEQRILRRALEVNRYQRKATARHLSLGYDQLRHLLKKHGLHQNEV